MSHLMLVAGAVLDHGGDEDEAIAALLHDAPEDRGGERRLEDIRARFGDRVAQIVFGCSDTLVKQKPEPQRISCDNGTEFVSAAKIEAWRQDYNEHRPHRALKGLSPDEYARGAMIKAAESPS